MKYTSLNSLILIAMTCACDSVSLAFAQNSAASSPNYGSGGGSKQLAFVSPSNDLIRVRDAAQSNYQASQFQTAIEMYKRVCQASGNDASAANDYYWLGEAYFHAHQYAAAAEAFNKAIALNPAADNVQVRHVEALLAAGQGAQAKTICSAAVSTTRDDYAKKQLTILAKVADMKNIKPPKSPNTSARTGHLEQ